MAYKIQFNNTFRDMTAKEEAQHTIDLELGAIEEAKYNALAYARARKMAYPELNLKCIAIVPDGTKLLKNIK